jgi:hypothetical protein
MMPTVTNDSTVIIAVILGMYFLVKVIATFPLSSRSSIAGAIQIFLASMAVLLFLSLMLYWHYRKKVLLQPGGDTWLIALDVVMAHCSVTLPIIVLVYFLSPIKLLTNLSSYTTSCVMEVIRSILLIFCIFVLPILAVKMLFIDSAVLQQLLFGEFDHYLGFRSPTTVRFSILADHIPSVFASLKSNQVIASVLAFLAVALGIMLGIAEIVGAIQKISEVNRADK